MQLDIRFRHILKRLAKEVLPVSRGELAAMLGVSENTIKNIIRSGRAPSDPFEIEFIKGKGYVLYIKFAGDFESYLQRFDRQVQGSASEQLEMLICFLLCSAGYVTIAKLEQQLQLSRGTILKLLGQAEEIFAEYSLSLDRKPKHGIRLMGSEEKIRWLTFKYLTNVPKQDTQVQTTAVTDRDYLQPSVSEALRHTDLTFQSSLANDTYLVRALVDWLGLVLSGGVNRSVFSENVFTDVHMEYANVLVLAMYFLNQLRLSYDYPFTDQDSSYVALHLGLHYERSRIEKLKGITHIVLCSADTSIMIDWLVLKISNLFPNAQVSTTTDAGASDCVENLPHLFLSTYEPVAGIDTIWGVPLIHIPHYLSSLMSRQLHHIAYSRLTVAKHIKLIDLFSEALFVKTKATDYLALLETQCQAIETAGLASAGFWQSVKERELKITTIYPGGIANPHPMTTHARVNTISVVVVENKLRYQDKQVELVFIVNLTNDQLHLHHSLSLFLFYLMENTEIKDRLRATRDFGQFKETLHKILS